MNFNLYYLVCKTLLLNVRDENGFAEDFMRAFNDHDAQAFGRFLHLYLSFGKVGVELGAVKNLRRKVHIRNSFCQRKRKCEKLTTSSSLTGNWVNFFTAIFSILLECLKATILTVASLGTFFIMAETFK